MSPEHKKWLLWGGAGLAGLVLVYLILSSSGGSAAPAVDDVGGVGGIDLGLPIGTGVIAGADGGAAVKSTSSGSVAKTTTTPTKKTTPATTTVHVNIPKAIAAITSTKPRQSTPADRINPFRNLSIP